MKTSIWVSIATVLAWAAVAAAGFEADVTITNTTGQDKTNWPVFLTVYKVFGGNLPIEQIHPRGFHVLDAASKELPHMLRLLPPDMSPGNDQIVFIVPTMAAGASMRLRVTDDARAGKTIPIDLASNPNNLLAGRGFERLADGAPEGFQATFKGAVKMEIDSGPDRVQTGTLGRGCLRIDLPAQSSATLRSAQPIQFRKDGRYHFSIWAKCQNLAYNGVPWMWGYDRFYDDWREQMKDYILRLDAEAAAGNLKAGKPGKAPPLPKPTGEVVHVRTPQELAKALDAARPGQTIMLADGVYDVGNLGFLHLAKDNMTLRGASGDPAKVILKGKGFKRHDTKEEMIKIQARGVTVADLTIRDVGANGIKLVGGNHNLLVHNVHFIDICERCIKAPHAPESRNGIVRYCTFEQVTPITPDIPGLIYRGDYIAGMDMMHIAGWRIHDNTFKNIRGTTGAGRGGIFLWQGCRDCIVERNTFIGCDRSISCGNTSGKGDMTGGIVRNNFIAAGAGQAIEICHAEGMRVYHNSIYHMGQVVDGRTITLEDSRGVDIRNNLVFSTVKGVSGKAETVANNLWSTDAALAKRVLVNPAAGDLHLKPGAAEAIGKGLPLPEVEIDWDGDRRSEAPDIGADQVAPASSASSAPARALPVVDPFALVPPADLKAIVKLAPKPPSLPQPTGKVVKVSDAEGLRKAVESAEAGTTILLADGRYPIERLVIRQDRLSLRGENGDRDKVVLDGGGRLTRIVVIDGGKDLLFADLTVANSLEYGIFFFGDAGAQRLKVYNVKFQNCLTRGLKGTDAAKVRDSWTEKHTPEEERRLRPIGGEVRYCLFVNDRASPRTDVYSGDYIGGIDIMSAKDWVVADNVFVDIRGQRGGGRGAIFFWINGENVVAERNIIVGCDRGICFGNPATPLGTQWHVTGGVIRNNFIAGGASEGIEVSRAKDVLVAHNTIWQRRPTERAVRFHVATPGCRLVNNLIRGSVEAPAENKGEGNIVGELEGWFKRPEIGDLHLTDKAKEAMDKGKPLPEVRHDFDGQKRKANPDVGADETARSVQPGAGH